MIQLLRDMSQDIFSLQKAGVFMQETDASDRKLILTHLLKESLLLKSFYDHMNSQNFLDIKKEDVILHKERAKLIGAVLNAFCPEERARIYPWEKELNRQVDLIQQSFMDFTLNGNSIVPNSMTMMMDVEDAWNNTLFSIPLATTDNMLKSFGIPFDGSLYLFISLFDDSGLETIRNTYVFNHYLKFIKK